MAAYKKRVVQKEQPKGRYTGQQANPDSYYQEYPAWNFSMLDIDMWQLSKDTAGDYFWSNILPRLQALEKQTWRDILLVSKKNNHSIDISELNPIAQKHATEKYVELDSIISLRIDGTHRIYGYITKNVFNILWYDPNHGDNERCVCRANLKHT